MNGKLLITSAAALLAGSLYAAAQTQPAQPGGHPATEPPQGAEQFPSAGQQGGAKAVQPRQGTIGQGSQGALPENQPVQPSTTPEKPLQDPQEQRN